MRYKGNHRPDSRAFRIFQILVLALLGWGFIASLSDIGNDDALVLFEEITNAEVEIVDANYEDGFIISRVFDVTFQLLVNGKPETGHCTSGPFKNITCEIVE